MKKIKQLRGAIIKIAFMTGALALVNISSTVAQVCNNATNIIFGLTGTADMHYINVNTGAVGARINPANSGTAPSLANAMGYNPVTGKVYYFKRNIQPNPQEFVVYDPLTNTVTKLANCPSGSLINLGCCTANGAGYYCIDAYGGLYYYLIASNSWVTISNNVRNEFNVTLPFIISGGAAPTATSRIYGDIAIDGTGNMWLLISGPADFGLYKLPAPLPVAAVAGVVTIFQQLPPTTPTPQGVSIGGVAFSATGEMFMSTNAGDNKLYRIEKNLSRTYLSTMTMDGIGTDLASCNYPMFVLPVVWKRFAATLKGQDNISLAWTIVESPDTKEYIVEHSVDGNNWDVLASIEANGNKGDVGNYAYNHNTSDRGKHYYRIVRMDVNERKTFSDTKMIYTYSNVSFALWPNPAQQVLQIETSTTLANPKIRLMIVDQTGRTIYTSLLEKGASQLDIRKLTPGNYLLTLAFGNGEKVSHRFLKQ